MKFLNSLLRSKTISSKSTQNVKYEYKEGYVVNDRAAEFRIIGRLKELGIEVQDYLVDISEYCNYYNKAQYEKRYGEYYSSNQPEKSLEHFIAAKLLCLDSKDIYVDVASEHSPVPEIYSRLYGCKTFRQDLAYPKGLNGDTIGGDAADMPIPNGFFSKMALHCSFEHFEGNADTRFIKETHRTLKKNGKLYCGPLYMTERYAIQTDPQTAARENVEFDDDAIIYNARGWGNRHARFYDPDQFKKRVFDHLREMKLRIYHIVNANEVDPSCYIRFAFLIEKP